MKSSSSPAPQREQGGKDFNVVPSQRVVDLNEHLSSITTQSPPEVFLHMDTTSEVAAPLRQIAPPRRTDHTYHDYATQIPSPYEYPINKKSTSNFPAKLHRMVSDPSNARAIQWQPHGRAWKVLDKELLVNVVIPKYFVQTKYESFTRQLSGWGFKRLHQTGPDYRCYYHECFLRGLPNLTRMMKRVEPYQGKLLPHAEAEPNFYDMQLVHPLPPSPSYSQPQPAKNFKAGSELVGAFTSTHGGHPPDWAPNSAPPYIEHERYPYGRFHGHGFPGNYPPPPPHETYSYPYPQPHTHQPFQQNPLNPPEHQEYMIPPYPGGNPAGAAVGMLPQLYPANRQPPPYVHQHSYNIYPPNPNEIGSHTVVPHPQPQIDYDLYSAQQYQPAYSRNLPNKVTGDIYLEQPDHQNYQGY